jgi:ABC-type transport system involved in multi-copper enzyme maturation permease subunit
MPIFEEKYQPWVGTPQSRAVRMAILAREEFKLIFSSLWMKIAIGLILFIAAGMSFLFFVLSSANLNPNMMKQFSGNIVYRTLLTFDSILIVALAAIVGSGLIAKDLRSNATLIYFSRPIGKLDYVMGKFTAAAACMALGTLVPTVLLWASSIIFKMEDIGWGSRLLDLGSIVFHSLLIIVPATSIVLALSACTRWTAAAGIVWVMIYLVSASVGAIGEGVTRDPWYGLCSLGQLWSDVGDFIYETRGKMEPLEHPYDLFELLGILIGLTALSWALLLWRVRRIERQ